MFNLMDVIVIVVIGLSAFIGYKRGFVKTAISLLSFVVAIGVALLFYKPLALVITEKTEIDEWIVEKIEYGREKPEELTIGGSGDSSEVTTVTVSEEQKEASIDSVLKDLPDNIVENFDLSEVKSNVKHEVAIKVSELAINIMSLIAIFVIVKVTLFIVQLLLGGMMKLPVLKQMNEILGLLFGILMALVELYIAFAFFTFLSSIADISFIIDAIKGSLIASFMFESNLIIKLLF